MTCSHKFKKCGRSFVEFWHEYFQSTGFGVRDLPIKYFISSNELLHLCDISRCKCKDLIQQLYHAYFCEICERTFATKTAFENHQLKYTMRLYDCVFCEKQLKSKKAILSHMELHTKEYECKACKKTVAIGCIEQHERCRKHLRNVRRMNME